MNLTDLLEEAKACGFTQLERHELGQVYRAALTDMQVYGTLVPEEWAYAVGKQHIEEQLSKWERLGYEVDGGKHRRAAA